MYTTGNLQFLQEHGTLLTAVQCPGPSIAGTRQFGCGKEMALKETNDTNDSLIWRCRKIHHCWRDGKKFTTKDIKITIRHMSWSAGKCCGNDVLVVTSIFC